MVLLHAYAGQGKSATAVEFARWYSVTGGLGEQPLVFLASFEGHTDLNDLLHQIGQPLARFLVNPTVDWTAVNDPAERLAVVKRILRTFPILWIWDNVEPVAGFPEGTESQWTAAEQNDLCDFLKQLKLDAASKVKILLASRRDEQNWLGKIPNRIPMPRMMNSDAAKLALKLGEERNLTRSEIADWQPLLDYCSGNPLTLRVLIGQVVKAGLRGRKRIKDFVEGIRSGEQSIEDADEKQGRDKSLGASLDYGFRHAFKDDELPIIALLHLFQGVVNVKTLGMMWRVDEHSLSELKDKQDDQITSLLDRAKDTGLLTHLGATWFTIHPALPWFLRQLFAHHYDGQAGRSTSQAALHAWVEAVSTLSTYYHDQFIGGNRGVIDLLELEEANLLHARRLAHRKQWWSPVISCMQGLRSLYQYQGRIAEWARLVEEIVPDYCTADNEPMPGREDNYTFVMGYRISLALLHEHDLARAAALQEKLVGLHRRRAAAALALHADTPLDDKHRNQMRTLGVSLAQLGHIRRDGSNPDCLRHYREAIDTYRCIGDKAVEAITEFNLGHAYMQVPAIRDLDAAEAAYQRSLDLRHRDDALGRSKCIHHIGLVHQERFREARKRKEPLETLMRHAQAAENHYLNDLMLCPKDSLADLVSTHNQLGSLYADVGRIDDAREHFEKSAQYSEKIGNHLHAGTTRFNMALMYARTALVKGQPTQQRASLLRARAYAEAALRDFQHYQGRAAKDEAETQRLLDHINQALLKLPQ